MNDLDSPNIAVKVKNSPSYHYGYSNRTFKKIPYCLVLGMETREIDDKRDFLYKNYKYTNRPEFPTIE